MFSVTISSENKFLLEQVERYAVSRGCSSGGVFEEHILSLEKDEEKGEEISTEVVPTPREVVYSRRPDTLYEVYGITRHGQVGYIGITSEGAAHRINQHLKKAEMAQDPFVQWLKEGLDNKDIDAGVIKTATGRNEAQKEEMRLIQKFQPQFNKRDGQAGLVGKIGGLKRLQLEGTKLPPTMFLEKDEED
jgi:hypothetical protein